MTSAYGCHSIMGGQYLVLVVESMTMGVCLTFIVSLSLQFHLELTPTETIHTDHIVSLLFVVGVFGGYLVTVPFYCYAVLRRKAVWVVPYLIWRVILSLMTVALALALCIMLPKRGLDRPETYWKVIPACAVEFLIGMGFFSLAFVGMREFDRIQRRCAQVVRRRPPDNYVYPNLMRAKLGAPPSGYNNYNYQNSNASANALFCSNPPTPMMNYSANQLFYHKF